MAVLRAGPLRAAERKAVPPRSHRLPAHLAFRPESYYRLPQTSRASSGPPPDLHRTSTHTGAEKMAEPLHSATASGNTEDTSLEVPSDNRQRTGQQRVLDQVHSIKRSKSKHGKNHGTGQSESPSSPKILSAFADFGYSKVPLATTNGVMNRSATLHSKSSGGGGYSKTAHWQNRSMSTRTVGSRNKLVSPSGQWDQQFNPSVWPQAPNGLKPSSSDPGFLPGPAPMRATGQTIRNNRSSMHSVHTNNFQTHVIRLPSTKSESKGSLNRLVKVEQDQSMQNSEISMANMTLKDAVDLLSHSEENFQHCGASFIQHCTFKEEGPKHEVLNLGGIPALVALLQSPNPDVSRSASAALRNLVFKDDENKKVVQQVGGIANAVQLLKETDSTETQKQLTGLLWNLSSADEQKKELIELALPVLTENVVVPFNCWSENSANNNIHPEVFYNATGCLRLFLPTYLPVDLFVGGLLPLRNLSCAQNKKERQTMRDCHGLIDSLMTYINSCVADDNPDDKSVDNCACILHNLSYQLEAESPVCFSKFNPAEAPGAQKDTTVGCFSPKSSKLHKEHVFDMNKSMKDDSVPSGVNWLCHPKTMQTYMTLLGTSQKDSTREACCGALQNLTAHNGPGASGISQILVQKMSALLTITPLLRSPNQTLQKTAMSLMGNMSRSSSLKSSIAKEVLPDLASILSSGRREMGNRDDTITTTCNNMRSLLFADSDVSKKILTP
ncbi:Plakophilin-1 [Merluccius polli]|uniref:Plakophilin-1 n=1 Tax=Merluccius polli TaxID=89951 RepID=A0AA47MRZ2_MERPO|nr:Plakophilin-1 [Merluccius polli]